MLLLSWRCRSTLLTCHVAEVFCFCSSSAVTAKCISIGDCCFVGRTWDCCFPEFIPPSTVVVYYIPDVLSFSSLSILLDSGFIFCMYFYRERYFCRKEPCMVYESFSFFFLFYALFVCALSSSNLPFFPGIQFSLVSELFASLVNAHAYVTSGMDGFSLISFCNGSMFF